MLYNFECQKYCHLSVYHCKCPLLCLNFQVPFILFAFFVHDDFLFNDLKIVITSLSIGHLIRTSAPPLDLLGIDCNQQPSMSGVSQAPVAVGRIKGDRNCIFRSIAQTLTGSQEDHEEYVNVILSCSAT